MEPSFASELLGCLEQGTYPDTNVQLDRFNTVACSVPLSSAATSPASTSSRRLAASAFVSTSSTEMKIFCGELTGRKSLRKDLFNEGIIIVWDSSEGGCRYAFINIDSLPPRLRRKEFIQRRRVEGGLVEYEFADENGVPAGCHEIHSSGMVQITNQGSMTSNYEVFEELPPYDPASERLPPYSE
ncbi:hypothetical protein NEOLEDRAFT_1171932 [Neolentinus lepideus HHB14362 ss-1]|uniref:Uncharacterized protein n=1 Tax=Neolentinus lepideus HHB14362 ss-1 TaxID=1314782 RepID=A0A165PTF1_9AGAM|nr:hypothetical protein NEOLEDRAFT_1171932 [Neolentinus lepideus HHB14362 ss-1]